MSRYQIIDEPEVRPWGEKLIVDPIFILLAAVFVPFIWQPPVFGRFWMPIVWLLVNGVALGSKTLVREILTIVAGLVGLWLLIMLVAALEGSGVLPFPGERLDPYVSIVFFGVFFTVLYIIVFNQGRSYALYKYARERE